MNTKRKEKNKMWFEDWFDSPYYHLLYKNRDIKEAKKFIIKLMQYLNPPSHSKILDAACGKGRHAIFIEELGFSIDGFDLAENSINIAKKFENRKLKFYVNDIRKPLNINHYNYALNLFTSFGYFDDENDNQLAIDSIAKSLKKNGLLVLDFMNANKIINNLITNETKTIEEITFNIIRKFSNNYITKDIKFVDKGVDYHFQEKVKALTLSNFKVYFKSAKLNIEAIFGDYELHTFNEETSNRLIILARKNE
jgi:SAM-dependent methyltransferase